MISVATLRTWLKLEEPEDLYDLEAQAAELEDLDARAVDAVERDTGRYFGPPVVDAPPFVVRGSGTAELYLPDYVSEVTGVSSRAYPGGAETEIVEDDADGWALRIAPGRTHGNVLVRAGGGVWSPGLQYVVAGAIGYAEGQEPPAIRSAVLMLCTHYNENRNPVVAGIAAELPESVQKVLQPFRRYTA